MNKEIVTCMYCDEHAAQQEDFQKRSSDGEDYWVQGRFVYKHNSKYTILLDKK